MGKADCQRFFTYLEKLWNGVRRAKAEGKTLEQSYTDLPLQDYPEMAKQPNESLRGTEWEILDIHRQNIDFFWKVLGK
jgi:plasmid stabilization system protein ParE